MAFKIETVIEEQTARMTLHGELDSLSARVFMTEIEKLSGQPIEVLVLDMEDLDFMSSAGLRVLIFSKQKIGTHLAIYIVKPQELIVDTLEKTGLHHSVTIVDQYPV
ncbi:anti-sigma factor antagonist [Dyadobacter psychrotolerans]|uniref:Anti-sigma factor antagonist n=1 Tax=Dyadobacter psychrotolerans TaxID=2541721 RepID=A0A4R5DUP5_9BACT|nr:anti-sigma factor antagonist [Dyadobacter psychrotolerans]TDE17507.1 STAS domain-containing protein [Dyadobacter psychrotolerans]